MNIEIKKSFTRDIKKLKDKKFLTLILEAIENIRQASSLTDINNIKKMDGSINYYKNQNR